MLPQFVENLKEPQQINNVSESRTRFRFVITIY